MKRFSKAKIVSLAFILSLSLVTAGQAASEATGYTAIESASVTTDKPDATATSDEIPSSFQKAAENGPLALYVDPQTGCFAVEDMQTGRRWWSVPQDIARDTTVKGKSKINLQSLLILEYFNPNDNIIDTVGSQSGAVLNGSVKTERISRGVRVHYDFPKIEIRLAIDIVLGGDSVTVTIPTQSIEEYGPYYLSGLKVLPDMCAGFADEDGWMLVPDGSGAIARFNNGRFDASYSAGVYGPDSNQTIVRQIEMTQSARLPVFGIQSGAQAMLGVITQSDGNAAINAMVSGKESMCNTVHPQFNLRRIDSYEMGQSTGKSRTVNLISTAPLSKTPMEVRYFLLEGDKASLGGMAEACRSYYRSIGMSQANLEGTPPVYLELLGAVYKKIPVAGIPVNSILPVTDFVATQGILTALQGAGIEREIVRYLNWNTDAIKGQICDSASPAGKLGGTGAYQKLMRQNPEIYPDAELTFVSNWQIGYGKTGYAAKSIKNIPTELFEHNTATYFADTRFGAKWLLSTAKIGPVGSKYLQSYKKLNPANISMGSTASVLYSDFSVRSNTRDDTKLALAALYRQYRDAGLHLMVSGGNAYAAIYADHIVNAPVASSRYDMLDESVPFYQMVFHGSKMIGSENINLAADPQKAFLRAVETGSLLSYSFIDPQNRENLQGTVFDNLYSADWTFWAGKAAAQYKALRPFYEKTMAALITDYRYLADGVALTVYDNGAETVVNYSEASFSYRDETIEPGGYRFWLEKEGRS